MKSLIIICVMGLISIFDCKVSDVNYRKEVTLGPELVDQVTWRDVGLTFWDSVALGWTGDGIKMIAGDGSSGSVEKLGLVTYGVLYRIKVRFIVVNGYFEMPGWIPSKQWNIPGTYDYYWDAKCGNAYGKLVLDHSGFTGEVLELSVKEILGYKIVEEE